MSLPPSCQAKNSFSCAAVADSLEGSPLPKRFHICLHGSSRWVTIRVRVGQVVKVRVLDVDLKKKRISLSMKGLAQA